MDDMPLLVLMVAIMNFILGLGCCAASTVYEVVEVDNGR